jgi:hypothetical protein
MRTFFLAPALALSLSAAMLAPASAQSIPSGSYQQSCQNIRIRNGMLVARCNGPQGLVRTTIDPDSCRRGDIVNANGQLACNRTGNGRRGYGNGYGYGNNGNGNNGNGNNGYGNNGYGNGNYGYGNGNRYGIPGGSYQQSCTNAQMNGGTLTASCPGRNGSITTSIDPRNCRGADIANVDGRLACK